MRDDAREYLISRMAVHNISRRPRQTTRDMADAVYQAEQTAVDQAEARQRWPGCFGRDWQGISAAPCRKCRLQMRCLHRQATSGAAEGGKRRDAEVIRAIRRIVLDGEDSPVPRPPARNRRVEQPWGEPTFAVRWLAERERNPLIAQLAPGDVLERQYHGDAVVVRVGHGYYEYQGSRYATLYAVTKAATGTRIHASRDRQTRASHAWSAKRFFFEAIHRAAVASL